MNILERAAKIPDGLKNMADMFGPEGIVEDAKTSQKRADICLKCPQNIQGVTLSAPIASAVKKLLEFRKNVDLTVEGEQGLGRCGVCDCEIKLLVHVPQKRVVEYLTEEERSKSPFHCWKLDKV